MTTWNKYFFFVIYEPPQHHDHHEHDDHDHHEHDHHEHHDYHHDHVTTIMSAAAMSAVATSASATTTTRTPKTMLNSFRQALTTVHSLFGFKGGFNNNRTQDYDGDMIALNDVFENGVIMVGELLEVLGVS